MDLNLESTLSPSMRCMLRRREKGLCGQCGKNETNGTWRCKDCQKKHKERNKPMKSSYDKNYRIKHKDKLAERKREYYKNNKDTILKRSRKQVLSNRAEWMIIIVEKNIHICSKCGYDKDFIAIDFHHINPKEKEKIISLIIVKKPTKKRIKELDKCIPLCANCHRIIHKGARK